MFSKTQKQVKFAPAVNEVKAVHDQEVDYDDQEEKSIVRKYLINKHVKMYNIISEYLNEFNWNSNETEIYWRKYENDEIKEYIDENYEQSKSGLMYVCGHPGTGKTSIIRVILKEIEEEMNDGRKDRNQLFVFNYNGMIFKKLYEFLTELIRDIRVKFYKNGKKSGKDSGSIINERSSVNDLESKLRQTDDVTDLGLRIQKYFLEFKHAHKLVVIDEVDNLSMTESAKNFVSFLNCILKSDTNATVIGIANSVDLLSKVSQYASKEDELVEK